MVVETSGPKDPVIPHTIKAPLLISHLTKTNKKGILLVKGNVMRFDELGIRLTKLDKE